jgi:lysine 6-dehydrogenase
MNPKLTPLEADTDICVMWNTVTGIKNRQKMRIDYYMWEEADIRNGISAMGRVTGFPAAIGARLVGKGEIKKRGIVPCEDAIEGEIYQKFMEELIKRNITILEVPETSQGQE